MQERERNEATRALRQVSSPERARRPATDEKPFGRYGRQGLEVCRAVEIEVRDGDEASRATIRRPRASLVCRS